MLRYTAPNEESFSHGSIEFQIGASTATYMPLEAGYPAWRNVIPSETTRVERDHIRFNVTHLTDLAKVKCEQKHPAVNIELHSSATDRARRGPVIVRFDDGPSILIMPLRGPED